MKLYLAKWIGERGWRQESHWTTSLREAERALELHEDVSQASIDVIEFHPDPRTVCELLNGYTGNVEVEHTKYK